MISLNLEIDLKHTINDDFQYIINDYYHSYLYTKSFIWRFDKYTFTPQLYFIKKLKIMKTDLEIQNEVMEELKWEPILSISEIGVAVKNGIVTLSGTVETYSKKLAAENAAKRVGGVKAVALDIDVALSKTGKRSDTEIAQAVVNALKWNTQLAAEKIKVKVEDGWVTLEGALEWEFQKTAARNAVENLYGVKGILNKITVSAKIKAQDIKQKIKSALQRSATVEAEKINIETIGDKVILKGTVRSWAEKIDAVDAACAAPGVSEVDDEQLEIESEVLTY